MQGHLKKTDIIKYITGASRKSASAMAEHISSCSRCAEKYAEMLPVITPSGCPEIEPGKKLEKRIIATYRGHFPARGLKFDIEAIVQWISSNRFRAALTAAAFIAVISPTLFFGLSFLMERDKLPIYVYYFRGSPTIDNEKVRYHMPIRDKSEIKVNRGSVLVLACKRRFIVKMYGNSEMILNKLSRKTSKGARQFVFNLRKGTIFTTYKQYNNDNRYFYFTPNASLATKGSSFIMKVAGRRTVVIPKEGVIDIKALTTEGSITTSPENEYIITSSIKINKPSAKPEARVLRNQLDKPFSDEEIKKLNELLDSMI